MRPKRNWTLMRGLLLISGITLFLFLIVHSGSKFIGHLVLWIFGEDDYLYVQADMALGTPSVGPHAGQRIYLLSSDSLEPRPKSSNDLKPARNADFRLDYNSDLLQSGSHLAPVFADVDSVKTLSLPFRITGPIQDGMETIDIDLRGSSIYIHDKSAAYERECEYELRDGHAAYHFQRVIWQRSTWF